MAIKRVSNLNEYVTRRLRKEMWINDEERSHSERTTAISFIALTRIPLALVAWNSKQKAKLGR